jgi:hypothetical protein
MLVIFVLLQAVALILIATPEHQKSLFQLQPRRLESLNLQAYQYGKPTIKDTLSVHHEIKHQICMSNSIHYDNARWNMSIFVSATHPIHPQINADSFFLPMSGSRVFWGVDCSGRSLIRPCSRSSRRQPVQGCRHHRLRPLPPWSPLTCSGSSRPTFGERRGSRGPAGSGCRGRARSAPCPHLHRRWQRCWRGQRRELDVTRLASLLLVCMYCIAVTIPKKPRCFSKNKNEWNHDIPLGAEK